MGGPLRLGELVATLALAQDNAFGQPLESQLRSCVLAGWLGEAAGHDDDVRATTYWVSLLRYVGCTSHSHEVAALFGDDIGIRAQSLVHDAGDPAEVVGDVIAYATASYPADEREAAAAATMAGLHDWVVLNFTSGCEAGDHLAERLGMSESVRESLAFTFERWAGTGFPRGAAGEEIPLPMRVVHLTHDVEAIARRFSPQSALDAVADRRGRTYDPAVADVLLEHGAGWLDRLAALDPWDAVLEGEPAPRRTLEGPDLDEALLVVADFVDVKSPYAVGHSRRCADLAHDAAKVLGLDDDQRAELRRAALVHELGMTSVSNALLDKPGTLTRAERDTVERHTLLTEQMVRRSDRLAALGPTASSHHERLDGTGYHKGLRADGIPTAARLLESVEVYVGLTTDRADRAAASPDAAAVHLRSMAGEGVLAAECVEACLAAAGHAPRRVPREQRPGGLSEREVEVLLLAARGRTVKQVAEELVLSPKTVDRHIQNVYTKIGVSTRAAAALWAVQNHLLD
ncbi:MAG: HD domain-containing phosphohydrolase [Candidatus Nanopelagicales bacterium]